MSTTRGRLVYSNQVIYDQADFFQLDGYTRVVGLTVSQVLEELYFNNVLQPWPLVSGVGVQDNQIAAGKVYWTPLPGGLYGVRFRPNAVGYWRLLITYDAGTQRLAQDYDVHAGTGISTPTGLKSSFIDPSGKGNC
jgi:hypothetical protein